MTKVLITDDHPLFREALRSAATEAFSEGVTVEARSMEEALQKVEAHGDFDLVLLDLSMPDTQGFHGLLTLRNRFPKLPVLVVSGMEDHRIITEAMSYGAAGFVPKSTARPELVQALLKAMDGEVYLPPSYREARGQDAAPGEAGGEMVDRLRSLTPQQLRVLQMLREGKLNKQIAYELDVGETTVKAHVSAILRKLKVFSRTQAVIEANKIDFDAILGHSEAALFERPSNH